MTPADASIRPGWARAGTSPGIRHRYRKSPIDRPRPAAYEVVRQAWGGRQKADPTLPTIMECGIGLLSP